MIILSNTQAGTELLVDGQAAILWVSSGKCHVFPDQTFIAQDSEKFPYAYWADKDDTITATIDQTFDWYFCLECGETVPPEHRHQGEKYVRQVEQSEPYQVSQNGIL